MREAITPRPSYGLLFATVLVVLLLLFVYSVVDTLLLFFMAGLLSLYLGGMTDIFEARLGIPRRWGVLLSFLVTTAAVTGICWLIVPPVLEQTMGLISALPSLVESAKAAFLDLVRRYPIFGLAFPSPDRAVASVTAVVGNVGKYFAGLFPYLFSGINFLIHLVSVLVMAVYLALRPRLYRDGVLALVPPVHRDLARDILSDLGTTLRAWIVGQLLAMVVLGTLTWVGLELLNVPYALAFGVFTGLVVMVPFFGTLISTLLPALFVLAAGGVVQALLVVLLGVVVHLFEANFVHPVIMERQVNLPPVLSILSVLVMAELLGPLGLVVAVPILASLVVIIRRVYVHRLLEGRGFRRFVRDSPVQMNFPPGTVLAHPAAADLSIPALLERSPEGAA
ncbi:MAG TPA: AI-2E family transporter, partial [Longimicrobiaceae bacterium]